jgi:hypothetical protein
MNNGIGGRGFGFATMVVMAVSLAFGSESALAAPQLVVTEGLSEISHNSNQQTDPAEASVGDVVGASYVIRNIGDETLTFDNPGIEFFNLGGPTSNHSTTFAGGDVAPGGLAILSFNYRVDSTIITVVQIRLNSNDPVTPQYRINMNTDVVAPRLAVNKGLVAINDGDTHDLGTHTVGDAIGDAFTLTNNGSGTLVIDSVSITSPLGLDNFNFPNLPIEIAEGGFGVLPFGFDALEAGNLDGELRLNSNDSDTPVYTIFLDAVIEEEEIVELFPKLRLSFDDATVNPGDTVDLGTAKVGESLNGEFDVANIGDADLSLVAPGVSFNELTNGDPADFAATISPSAAAPGDSMLLNVTFSPRSEGERIVEMTVQSDDPDTPEYTVTLTAEGNEEEIIEQFPRIQVVHENQQLASGDTVTLDDTLVGGQSQTSLAIRNIGNATLELSNFAADELVTGNLDDFTIQLNLATIDPGEEATMNIRHTPSAAGPREVVFTMDTNDPDNTEFEIVIDAFGEEQGELNDEPRMEISVDDETIRDGDTYDLGTVAAGETASETFVISNTGDADLLLSGSLDELTDGNEDDFTGQLGATTVAPGESTTMTISLNTSSKGERVAEVTVESNDPNNTTVTFEVTAEVITDCNLNGSEDDFDLQDGVSDDCNGNSVPDECETDSDNDGVIDSCDRCPGQNDELDSDNDGVEDCRDNCPTVANESQLDFDGDGVGEACEDLNDDPGPPGSFLCGATGAAMLPVMMLGLCGMRGRRRGIVIE